MSALATLKLTLNTTSNEPQQPTPPSELSTVGAMHPDCLPLPLAASNLHGSSPQLQQPDSSSCDADDGQLLNIEDAEERASHSQDEDEELDDVASCCSENSVLSVGQEHSQVAAVQARQRLLMSQLYRPSAFSSVPHATNPSSVDATPASFQEEFLRKSQLYAEELMKQQMQLMAAARVNALTAAVMPLGSKMSQQLQMAAAAAAAAMRPTVPGQDALAQLTATALGITPAAHSHQLLMQQQQQQQQQQHYGAPQQSQAHASNNNHNHNSNNNNNNNNNNNINNNNNNFNEHLHERALKFSIDNILKADFGSRLQQRAAAAAAAAAAASAATPKLKLPRKCSKPLNLAQSPTQPSLSFSSTLANICSNSNDSNSTATSSSTTHNNNNNNTSAVDLVKAGSGNSPSPASGNKAGEDANSSTGSGTSSSSTPIVWPAWVYCTRYSDRPSSGRSPRTRKPKKPSTSSAAGSGSGDKSDADSAAGTGSVPEDKRPRTAFSGTQLARLKHEFNENRYLTEKRRQQLSGELGLNEAQIKIWFQNKRAKLKKSSGTKNPLALQLMAQGLYNHSTIPLTREEEELQELQEASAAAAASASASASASTEPT